MQSLFRVLVTGAAGFIGFHLSKKLCHDGYTVLGIDNLNDYYDVNIKESRLKILRELPSFTFKKCDLTDYTCLDNLLKEFQIDVVVNLAAQAGVRSPRSVHPDRARAGRVDTFRP